MGWAIELVCASALMSSSVAAATPPDINKDVIEYRQHIMSTLNEQAAALGQILSGAIPDDNLAAHLEAIALTSSTALKAFERKVPGGEAKAEVWSNWADFSKRMNEFVRKTAQTAKAAQQGVCKDDLTTDIVDALSCKSCHETYRSEKKK